MTFISGKYLTSQPSRSSAMRWLNTTVHQNSACSPGRTTEEPAAAPERPVGAAGSGVPAAGCPPVPLAPSRPPSSSASAVLARARPRPRPVGRRVRLLASASGKEESTGRGRMCLGKKFKWNKITKQNNPQTPHALVLCDAKREVMLNAHWPAPSLIYAIARTTFVQSNEG